MQIAGVCLAAVLAATRSSLNSSRLPVVSGARHLAGWRVAGVQILSAGAGVCLFSAAFQAWPLRQQEIV
jgi:hypothetical protein